MIRSELQIRRSEVVAERGAAAGGHQLEAEAAVRIMEQGGNAVDGLVAAAFLGFVVEPEMCHLGGYARIAIYSADTQELLTIDSYSRVPKRGTPDMFEPDNDGPLTYYGWPFVKDRLNMSGHLAVPVPGAVAGFCAAHERFGRLPLKAVLEPAIERAEAGVPVSYRMALMIGQNLELIQRFPTAAAFLLQNGQPLKMVDSQGRGDRLDTSDLARTLKVIAERGAGGFYGGPIAEAIEKEMIAGGGILRADDLAEYRPKIYHEQPQAYRGRSYITAGDQIANEALHILDQFDLRSFGPESVEARHLMAEALGHAFVDSMMYYADPDYYPSPLQGLAAASFGRERASGIRSDRAAPRPILAGNPWPHDPNPAPTVLPTGPSRAQIEGTSQMIAADCEGNMAVTCTSVGTFFGSMVCVPGTGIFLTNGMQNYDPRPGFPNSIAPGKMPIFGAPVLIMLEDGRPIFGGSGSGGYRIGTGVLHTLVHTLDHGMPVQEASELPRVHCQGNETFVDARISQDVRDRLRAMGHRVVVEDDSPVEQSYGRVSAIYVDPVTRTLHTAANPATSTGAAGF